MSAYLARPANVAGKPVARSNAPAPAVAFSVKSRAAAFVKNEPVPRIAPMSNTAPVPALLLAVPLRYEAELISVYLDVPQNQPSVPLLSAIQFMYVPPLFCGKKP